ncbi:MAG: DUF1566 domain-containing protein [Candidatus Contendobacter sp.]
MMTPFTLARAGLTGAGLLLATWLPGWAVAAGLNDTGITGCADATQNNLTCPQASFPRQDAETGRDAQVGLSKAGGGSAGFDFTKLDNNGNPLDASATSWDCVRDDVTGLIWEIKTDDNGLRDQDWAYTWCNNNASTNGGNAGTCDTGSGVGSDDCADNARCDTEKYTADVNALPTPLCGYRDWRMPTREELRTIVDYSRFNPAIDTTAAGFFPRTVSTRYWSASPNAFNADNAWNVLFINGKVSADSKGRRGVYAVRLVRGGQ